MRKLILTLVIAALACNSFAYYQAQQGRWISRYPKVEAGGKNLYAFNYNAPNRYIDPDGRAPQYIYPGVILEWSPENGGYIIQSPDQDWGDYDPMWGGRGAGQGAPHNMGTTWFVGGEAHFIVGSGFPE